MWVRWVFNEKVINLGLRAYGLDGAGIAGNEQG